jgi:hypothetical protein
MLIDSCSPLSFHLIWFVLEFNESVGLFEPHDDNVAVASKIDNGKNK